MYTYIIASYLILINTVALIMFGIDKYKSKREGRRIPEYQLLGAAILGGSIGAFWGMFLFRHKTKHLKFFIGLPIILSAQILLIAYLTKI